VAIRVDQAELLVAALAQPTAVRHSVADQAAAVQVVQVDQAVRRHLAATDPLAAIQVPPAAVQAVHLQPAVRQPAAVRRLVVDQAAVVQEVQAAHQPLVAAVPQPVPRHPAAVLLNLPAALVNRKRRNPAACWLVLLDVSVEAVISLLHLKPAVAAVALRVV